MKLFISILVLLTMATGSINAFECLDHTNTAEENIQCIQNTLEEALSIPCADHTSTSEEIEYCKEEVKALCYDHTSTAEEILDCILSQ